MIDDAKPREEAKGLTVDGGLASEALPSGSKTWRYKYHLNGKRQKVTIGVHPAFTIERARDRHEEPRAPVEHHCRLSGKELLNHRPQAGQAGRTHHDDRGDQASIPDDDPQQRTAALEGPEFDLDVAPETTLRMLIPRPQPFPGGKGNANRQCTDSPLAWGTTDWPRESKKAFLQPRSPSWASGVGKTI